MRSVQLFKPIRVSISVVMKKRRYQDWVDLHWQGSLSDAELKEFKAFLADHPDHAKDWKLDEALLRGVKDLADGPLPEGFTQSVLEAVDEAFLPLPAQVDSSQPVSPALRAWSRGFHQLWRHPMLRVSGMAAGLTLGWLAWHWSEPPDRLAISMSQLDDLESLPSIEELKDFQAISGMAQASVDVDWELILAMD
jgi:ferric-dicitrate binding protein FerR (iron transport regulator)